MIYTQKLLDNKERSTEISRIFREMYFLRWMLLMDTRPSGLGEGPLARTTLDGEGVLPTPRHPDILPRTVCFLASVQPLPLVLPS